MKTILPDFEKSVWCVLVLREGVLRVLRADRLYINHISRCLLSFFFLFFEKIIVINVGPCERFADKLFKGKEESQNGCQSAAVAKCLNTTSSSSSAATAATQQQKTETNNGRQQQQARRRSSHGPTSAATVATATTAAADGGGDLIHLPGPLTEDAVLKALHSRFCATQMFVSNVKYVYTSLNTARYSCRSVVASMSRKTKTERGYRHFNPTALNAFRTYYNDEIRKNIPTDRCYSHKLTRRRFRTVFDSPLRRKVVLL